MGTTKIEWCDAVFNPIVGCSKVSPACDHCYAERMARRQVAMGNYDSKILRAKGFVSYGGWSGKVQFFPDRMTEPLHWKKPRRIFVCSMGDLFHEDVKNEWIDEVFGTMIAANQHVFMLLTKRPGRMLEYVRHRIDQGRDHIWLGVTAEDQQRADERIPLLLQCQAAVRFVSCEPLLGPIDLTRLYGGISFGDHVDLIVDALGGNYAAAWRARQTLADRKLADIGISKLDWVIAGGETGPGARPSHPDWFRSIRDQCQAAGVPYFFKGTGTAGRKFGSKLLDGCKWNEMPEVK